MTYRDLIVAASSFLAGLILLAAGRFLAGIYYIDVSVLMLVFLGTGDAAAGGRAGQQHRTRRRKPRPPEKKRPKTCW